MRALARIVAVADPARGTRLAALRGDPPLLLRRTLPSHPDGAVQLHLVGGAAGPLGGDDLRIDVEVGPGARLCVRSVAATLALPGSAGGESRLRVTARVATGGRLHWLPEPLIGAAGCDHRTISTIDLAEGAALRWREELVCGRYAEPVGDVRIETTLRYGGRTLLRNDLAVGPRAGGWSGAAVLGDARAVGTVLMVDPAWSAAPPPTSAPYDPAAGPVPGAPDTARDHCAAAVLPLAGGPAVLVSVVAADARTVRSQLDRLRAATDAAGRTLRVGNAGHSRSGTPDPLGRNAGPTAATPQRAAGSGE